MLLMGGFEPSDESLDMHESYANVVGFNFRLSACAGARHPMGSGTSAPVKKRVSSSVTRGMNSIGS